jgi:ribose 1,5-bisphosphokinase PhnN
MPEICRFLGIVILMHFSEHNPPHFHVEYNEYKAVIVIASLNVMEGRLPARVRGLVEEWAELHREDLLQMWTTKDFTRLPPLV